MRRIPAILHAILPPSSLVLSLATTACAESDEPTDAPTYRLLQADYPIRDGERTICEIREAQWDHGVERWEEWYALDRMDAELAGDARWRERFGADGVHTCDDARRYQRLRLGFVEAQPRPEPPRPGGFPEETGVVHVAKIGEATGLSDHPAVVRLKRDPDSSSNGCSGTLIHPRVVLTAAHCWGAFTGTIGITHEQDGALQDWQELDATFTPDPNYTGVGDAMDDMGVLIFDDAVPGVVAGADTMRVLVSALGEGDDIVFHGWGARNHEGDGVGTLRYGQLDVDWAGPAHFLDEVNTGDPRICKGDSGGPARLNRTVHDLTFDFVAGTASEYTNGSAFCPKPGGVQRWSMTADKIAWIEQRLVNAGIDLTPDAATACLRASQSGRDYMRCW